MGPVELLESQVVALEAQIHALRCTLEMLKGEEPEMPELPEIPEQPSGPRTFGGGTTNG